VSVKATDSFVKWHISKRRHTVPGVGEFTVFWGRDTLLALRGRMSRVSANGLRGYNSELVRIMKPSCIRLLSEEHESECELECPSTADSSKKFVAWLSDSATEISQPSISNSIQPRTQSPVSFILQFCLTSSLFLCCLTENSTQGQKIPGLYGNRK
jgi:hypothetical protein